MSFRYTEIFKGDEEVNFKKDFAPFLANIKLIILRYITLKENNNIINKNQ